jgi:phosphate transport system substrate-binding protein
MTNDFRSCVATLCLLAAAACGGDRADTGANGNLRGNISADGSSTVFPITEAVAEEFGKEHNGQVRVTVGLTGTGGGFKRFCAGETDISNASRPIKDSEKVICQQNQVTYIEIPVAYDGLSVIVNPRNNFVQCLTVAELKKVWEPGSTVKNWSDVRPGLPNQAIKLYGPGTSSGTFDYFTEEIVGKQGASRADYTASEDDNMLVQGVGGDASSLGYFGFSYYQENAQRLKLVAVDGGSGCVIPSEETIKNGSYKPLSRPLFIYVTNKAMQRPEVKAFVEYYLNHATELVPQVGYVPLESAQYQEQLGKLGNTTTARR